MTLQSQNFQPLDVLEAVKLNKDLPSALKYLSHTCPICEEQVTFSKVRPPGLPGQSQYQSCMDHCLSLSAPKKLGIGYFYVSTHEEV
jgi:hypothetical protein